MPHISKKQQQINKLSKKKSRFTSQEKTYKVIEVQNESTLRTCEEDENISQKTHEVIEVQNESTLRTCEEDENISQETHEVIEIQNESTLRMCEEDENIVSTNMLLNAEASSNMLLDNKTLNDILLDASASSNILLSQLCKTSSSFTDTASILHICLEDINKQYEQGKMNASFQVAQTLWNKGDYMSRCIRKWSDYYIESGELFSYHQGKHKKSISLFDNKDFLDGCQEWLQQQSPES
ncbi:2531_t:CDS:2 [Cetraspora pellucida]|uniref:2531_t:CDS:1 n=1 Tax=Cetraspora pellucida TaxID=1433469 RepID=A0ACA9KFV5_9GLOM|nr:2531_t:CDS:2 [Cetraspora pellucida]